MITSLKYPHYKVLIMTPIDSEITDCISYQYYMYIRESICMPVANLVYHQCHEHIRATLNKKFKFEINPAIFKL